MEFLAVAGLILVALSFDFISGLHDAAQHAGLALQPPGRR